MLVYSIECTNIDYVVVEVIVVVRDERERRENKRGIILRGKSPPSSSVHRNNS